MKNKSMSCQESHPGRDAVLRELVPAQCTRDRHDPGMSSWGHTLTLMETLHLPCPCEEQRGIKLQGCSPFASTRMYRPQPQITQSFIGLLEVFLPCFNPLWVLSAFWRWLVRSPWAQVLFFTLLIPHTLHPSWGRGLRKPLWAMCQWKLATGSKLCINSKYKHQS